MGEDEALQPARAAGFPASPPRPGRGVDGTRGVHAPSAGPGRARPGTGLPQPGGRRRGGEGRRRRGGGLARGCRDPSRGGRRLACGGRPRPWRHPLRQPGAVRSPRANPAVRPRHRRVGRAHRGRGHGRSESGGERSRVRPIAFGGHRGGDARARGGRRQEERGLRQARSHRAPARGVQDGGDAGRKGRGPRRLVEVDHGRRCAGAGSSDAGRFRRDRHRRRHGARR